MKRGNLYPEQHQIGMRVVSATEGGPSKHAGRWLERASNGEPRGMIARQRKLAYRIRPTGLPCTSLFVILGQTLVFQFTNDIYFHSQSTDLLELFVSKIMLNSAVSPCCH